MWTNEIGPTGIPRNIFWAVMRIGLFPLVFFQGSIRTYSPRKVNCKVVGLDRTLFPSYPSNSISFVESKLSYGHRTPYYVQLQRLLEDILRPFNLGDLSELNEYVPGSPQHVNKHARIPRSITSNVPTPSARSRK
jgi:hypothetical protein